MAGVIHSELVALGASWLRRQGFPVVHSELSAIGCREQPDVIGFRAAVSAMLEVKASRSDFLADRDKPERSGARLGVGVYRFYLCPPGLIEVAELPPRWGLLYGERGKITEVHRPPGNIWSPTSGTPLPSWAAFQHEVDVVAEHALLFSIARRLAIASRRKVT